MDALEPREKAVVSVEIIMYIVGTIGNLVVIFMILYLEQHKKTSHWYILQLALADLTFLQSLPVQVQELTKQEWIHSQAMCKAKLVVRFINYYASGLFLSLMAVDRYLVVCRGITEVARTVQSTRFFRTITALAWIVAILMCIPVMIFSDRTLRGIPAKCQCRLEFPLDAYEWCEDQYDDPTKIEKCTGAKFKKYSEGYKKRYSCDQEIDTSNGISKRSLLSFDDDDDIVTCKYQEKKPGFITFAYLNFFIMFLVPLIVISVCYALIVFEVRKSATSVRSHIITNANDREMQEQGEQPQSTERSSSSRQQTRLTVTCFSLVVAFVLCWLPFHAMHLLKIEGREMKRSSCDVLQYVIDIFLYVNAAVNPYLYSFLCAAGNRCRDIRNHRRSKMLTQFFCGNDAEEQTSRTPTQGTPTRMNGV